MARSKRTSAPAPVATPPSGSQAVSKRTSAPTPVVTPPSGSQAAPSVGAQPVPSATIPAVFGSSAWCSPFPPQAMTPSSAPYWVPGLQQQGMAGSSSQVPWWTPPSSGNMEDTEPQLWEGDSTPPGGFMNLLNKNTGAQAKINGSSSRPININDDPNGSGCPRTRMLWTKDEDEALVGAWVNNSNGIIHSNYKKNEQYWGEVTAAYNRAIPKGRARQMKQIKDRFGRIKERVQWFCGSWKEANALWASGESDADLMEKALKLYEEEHKKDGPFMFKHCWDILRKEPKWDAYLERLAELDPDKRKFNVDDDFMEHISVESDTEERPIGGKKAKELQKRKRKDEGCIIDLEDELQIFVEAQNKANEGRKEMLETQKRVSSENLEAKKLAYLAAKESKESTMLETYRELFKQDTTAMAEDVRAEHVLALRSLREKLFGSSK